MASTNGLDLTRTPALQPPAGVTPNFVDPFSLSSVLVGTLVVSVVSTTFSLFARLFTSIRAFKRIRIEDYTCILSWLGLLATHVVTTLAANEGVGRHQWDVPLANMPEILKLSYGNQVLYCATIMMAKVTVLLQIMRLFVATKQGLVYWTIQVVIWLNVLFYLANLLAIIFQCTPVEKAWNPVLDGTCFNTVVNFIVTTALNIVSDFMILLLPLWAIWHLQIPLPKKLGVASIFAVGILACVASIVKLVYAIAMIRSADYTFKLLECGLWSIAEITIVIICAALPIIPRFVQLLFTKPTTSTSPYSKENSGLSGSGRSRRFIPLTQQSAEPWRRDAKLLQETVTPVYGAGDLQSRDGNGDSLHSVRMGQSFQLERL